MWAQLIKKNSKRTVLLLEEDQNTAWRSQGPFAAPADALGALPCQGPVWRRWVPTHGPEVMGAAQHLCDVSRVPVALPCPCGCTPGGDEWGGVAG